MNSTVVKSLAQKNGLNSFNTPLPIGADAEYVSMKSQLNLEEELKLGGNKVTMISMSTYSLDEHPTTTMSYYRIRQYYSNDVITIDNITPIDGRPTISEASTASIDYTIETNLYNNGLITINPINVANPLEDDVVIETQLPEYLADNNQRRIVSIQSQFEQNPEVSLIYISNIYEGYKSLSDLQDDSALQSVLHQKKIVMTATNYSLGI